MQITDVRVRKVSKEGKMKAVVSITLDNEFVVHDIKVIEGEKGLFIAMPSRKAADGSIVILPIPLIPRHGRGYKISFSRNTRSLLWKVKRKKRRPSFKEG